MTEYTTLYDININEFFSTINNIRSIYLLKSKVLLDNEWKIKVLVLDFATNNFNKIVTKKFKSSEMFSKRTKTQVLNRAFIHRISS